MASSWPSSALVDGVKIGIGSFSDSRSPGGSSMPETLPVAVVLPARAGDVPAHDALDRQHLQLLHGHRAAGSGVRNALGRPEMQWLGTMCPVRLNQKAEMPVRTLPLSGIPFGCTTS